MKYRLTCLTPLLAGDGHKLSPIDYMVWKDHVNVLDQRRIFRLLAKGPRLEGYLAQLKKAEKLDFASWGGFAQNFAGRRIPFEHPSAAKYWEASRGDTLHIPTFVSSQSGPYLPGSALKGALRTGMLFTNWKNGSAPPDLDRLSGDRFPRRLGEAPEDRALGGSGLSMMRAVSIADSARILVSSLKLYMLRVSTLEPRRGGGYDLGWKQAPRGTAPGTKPQDSTPLFAEMAAPGTVFEGNWRENAFLAQPEIARLLRWREPVSGATVLAAANEYAARLLAIQKQYAALTGIAPLRRGIDELESQLSAARAAGNACLVALGWGSGLLAKTAWLETDSAAYREVLKQVPLYTRALESNLPFPKTRKIVFLNDQPAALPGWALLEVG